MSATSNGAGRVVASFDSYRDAGRAVDRPPEDEAEGLLGSAEPAPARG